MNSPTSPISPPAPARYCPSDRPSDGPSGGPSDGPGQCPLCRHDVQRILAAHPAYAAPGHFDVYRCDGCDTHFSWPLASSAAIYELIYAAGATLPGYDRYERYRTLLPGSANPLDVLADSEDVYWGVRSALAEAVGEPVDGAAGMANATGRRLRVLEIGSGLGYLTYALHRAGHDATGIDQSQEAVAKACATFGPLYRVAPAESLADAGRGLFDVVVATEVIEHLADPQGFMRDAASLLAPRGRLILTTPNRGLYPRDLAWHTDPAPVHLWWFSATSLRRLAWQCGLQPSFVDFSAFYGRAPRTRFNASKPQPLDWQGRSILRDSAINTLARALIARWPSLAKPIGKIFLWRLGRQVARENWGRDSLCLCVVLKADDSAAAVEPGAA